MPKKDLISKFELSSVLSLLFNFFEWDVFVDKSKWDRLFKFHSLNIKCCLAYIWHPNTNNDISLYNSQYKYSNKLNFTVPQWNPILVNGVFFENSF